MVLLETFRNLPLKLQILPLKLQILPLKLQILPLKLQILPYRYFVMFISQIRFFSTVSVAITSVRWLLSTIILIFHKQSKYKSHLIEVIAALKRTIKNLSLFLISQNLRLLFVFIILYFYVLCFYF